MELPGNILDHVVSFSQIKFINNEENFNIRKRANQAFYNSLSQRKARESYFTSRRTGCSRRFDEGNKTNKFLIKKNKNER